MKLTKKILQLSNKYKTPFLIVDTEQIKKNYHAIENSLPGVEIFYSMKANNHPRIVKSLLQEGASFDITSEEELKLLDNFNTPAEKLMCFNPIKSPGFLQTLATKKVDTLAYDSYDEVDKIAKFAPGSKLVLRIVIDNQGSDWPLTKKYGVDAAEAIPLLKYAKNKNLKPIGLTFHVGSQCRNKNNWVNALYVCEMLWNMAKKEHIELSLLSLGGGLPVQHTKPIPSLNSIGKGIIKAIKSNFSTTGMPLRITIEPGRAVVGDSAIMISSVIGKAKRGEVNWIYIDVGVFNGFMETIDNFTYEIKTVSGGGNKKYTIGGPSCDSVDIPFKNILLGNVNVGDKLYILNAGAYTTVYASEFNGFEIPKTYFIEN